MAKYDSLTFTDDFMFSHILKANPDLCASILSLLLPWPVEDIVVLNREYEIRVTPDGKGVRFDIYLKDNAKKIYSIEMLNYYENHLPFRSRYYQAASDMEQLERGASYCELTDSIIIFISSVKNAMPDRAISTYKRICLENRNEELGDGTTIMFVNPWGKRDNINKETGYFLDYLKGLPAADPLTSRIDLALQSARQNTIWRSNYMTLEEHYERKRLEGVEQGLKQGLKQGVKQGISQGIDMNKKELRAILDKGKAEGLSVEEIYKQLEESITSDTQTVEK